MGSKWRNETGSLALKRERLESLKGGYPWVWRTEVVGEIPKGAPGDLIRIVDGKGRGAAWALLDEGPIVARVLGRERRPAPPRRAAAGITCLGDVDVGTENGIAGH